MGTTDKSMLEQLELLLDNVNIQLWTLQGTHTYGIVNKAHADFIGKRKEDMENKELKDILIEKEGIRCTASNMKVWKEKKQIISKEWRTNSKGEARLLEITKTPILDKGDDIKYIICKGRDITEEEERKNKLKINEQQYRALVENQKSFVCKFLPNTELTFVNQAYCDFFDKKYKELIGTKFLELIPEKYHEGIKNNIASMNTENPIQTYHHAVLNSKREIMWQKWTDQGFFDDNGELVEFQSIGIDITELKKKERTLQQEIEESKKKLHEMVEYDKLKTEFFANISHELRTPLNLILSTLQLVDYKSKNNILESKYIKNKHYIIRQNCYRLLRLINNLIDITKIDSGYFSINLKNYNVINIVEDITLSVAEYVKNKDINLLFDTEMEEKIMACDPDQIERIVLNLLSNAVKFTNPGGNIMVYIQDRGESISIRVKDTGIGIPEDKINMIFQRFKQIDKTFIRSHEGSGIGLSLAKSLVKMHEGKMTVKSEYGKGSEFIIDLPVKVIEHDEEKIENSNEDNHVESINIEFSDIYSINL